MKYPKKFWAETKVLSQKLRQKITQGVTELLVLRGRLKNKGCRAKDRVILEPSR